MTTNKPFLALSTNIYSKLYKQRHLERFMTKSIESISNLTKNDVALKQPAIVIADTLNRFGEYTFNHRNMEISKKRSQYIGDLYSNEINKIYGNSMQVKPNIIHWDCVCDSDHFKNYFDKINDFYACDDAFKKLVDFTAKQFIIYRSSSNSKKLLNKRHEIDMMVKYILEEIPLSAFGLVFDDTHYNCLIHPILRNHLNSEPILTIIEYIKNLKTFTEYEFIEYRDTMIELNEEMN